MKIRSGFVSNSSSSSFVVIGYKFDQVRDFILAVYNNVSDETKDNILEIINKYKDPTRDNMTIEEIYQYILRSPGNQLNSLVDDLCRLLDFGYEFSSYDENSGHIYIGAVNVRVDGKLDTIIKEFNMVKKHLLQREYNDPDHSQSPTT